MNNAKLKQLINIAKNDLAMDEDSYRGNLTLWTGKESLKVMGNGELKKVYDGMKGLGFKPTSSFGNKKTKGISPKFFEDHPEAKKLGWIWTVMKAQGFVKSGAYTALEKWAIPQSKSLNDGEEIQKLEWMGSILYQLIEQLKSFHKRKMIENGWIVDQVHKVEKKLEYCKWPVLDREQQRETIKHQESINRIRCIGNDLGSVSHDNLSKCWQAVVYFNGLVKQAAK